MNQFDVVGFGALNIDKLFKVNKIAGAEEEGFIIDCQEWCGGSAANTAVGLARLGCKVGFIGKVADDREGKMLIEDFQKEGVDTNGIIHAKTGRSGTVMGFVDQKGERALYVDPGVNSTIEFEEINKDYAFQTKFLHLTSFVGEKSFQTQIRLVEMLSEKVKVSLDPGELYARKGLTALEPIIRRAFVLMPNQRELELLTKARDYRKGAGVLLEKGVKIVAVKLGSKGCYVTDGKENHQINRFNVKVVDTTGAGDAFCAGFLYGLLNGKSLYECGRLGNFVASKCIMKMGARTGLPRLEDLKLLH
ncbi:MAG: carbohydrate kinase family protein [Candidatus Bathyarchaeota archaeon]|nr:carbohydrate kinase family protein [Candidatus Bathyarchaeota archaeon]MDI6805267.1 carbohydrate kinase family protein [Candidatus Bathyarchaeia archaeon]